MRLKVSSELGITFVIDEVLVTHLTIHGNLIGQSGHHDMQTLRSARITGHSRLPKGDHTNSFHVYLVDLNGRFHDFAIYDSSSLMSVLNNKQTSNWWGPVYGTAKHAELMALARAKHGQLVDVDFKNGIINAIRDADPTYVPPPVAPVAPPPSRSFFELYAASRKASNS